MKLDIISLTYIEFITYKMFLIILTLFCKRVTVFKVKSDSQFTFFQSQIMINGFKVVLLN